MKRRIAVVLMLVMALLLVACGKEESKGTSDDSWDNVQDDNVNLGKLDMTTSGSTEDEKGTTASGADVETGKNDTNIYDRPAVTIPDEALGTYGSEYWGSLGDEEGYVVFEEHKILVHMYRENKTYELDGKYLTKSDRSYSDCAYIYKDPSGMEADIYVMNNRVNVEITDATGNEIVDLYSLEKVTTLYGIPCKGYVNENKFDIPEDVKSVLLTNATDDYYIERIEEEGKPYVKYEAYWYNSQGFCIGRSGAAVFENVESCTSYLDSKFYKREDGTYPYNIEFGDFVHQGRMVIMDRSAYMENYGTYHQFYQKNYMLSNTELVFGENYLGIDNKSKAYISKPISVAEGEKIVEINRKINEANLRGQGSKGESITAVASKLKFTVIVNDNADNYAYAYFGNIVGDEYVFYGYDEEYRSDTTYVIIITYDDATNKITAKCNIYDGNGTITGDNYKNYTPKSTFTLTLDKTES